MARIGPGIAVMEIDHDLESHRTGCFGKRNAPRLIEIAHARTPVVIVGFTKVRMRMVLTPEFLRICSALPDAPVYRSRYTHALQLGHPSDIGSNDGSRCQGGCNFINRGCNRGVCVARGTAIAWMVSVVAVAGVVIAPEYTVEAVVGVVRWWCSRWSRRRWCRRW